MICSLRDVSERQRVARHLERTKAAAETAARVKTEFLANMSHELRTPLTGILGIHDLLHDDPTLGRQQKRYLGLARDAGRSLLSIVNDVLDFTKMEAGQFSLETVPFELGALIQACGDLVQGDARRKSLRVESSIPDGPLHLMGDPTRLRQILLNLLTNAIKFTERGSVSIAASYDLSAKRLRVAVSDTGIGIPSGTLPLLFERFSQADASITRRYGGTGLGLAISKRLVELMGGKIGVDSNLGAGSTFWFEIPLREVLGEDRHPAAAHPTSIPSRLRVLLAEDNDINQDIISAMLEQRGHAVTVVSDGAAAVAAVRAGPRYAIILMDLQMPVMDGLSATRAIRTEEAQAGEIPTPVIGLTANAMAEDVMRCRQAGMDAHVAKPIAWPELFDTIERFTEAAPNLDDHRSTRRPSGDRRPRRNGARDARGLHRTRTIGRDARCLRARGRDQAVGFRCGDAVRNRAARACTGLLGGTIGIFRIIAPLCRVGEGRARRRRPDPGRRGSNGRRPRDPGGPRNAIRARGLRSGRAAALASTDPTSTDDLLSPPTLPSVANLPRVNQPGVNG